MWTSMSIEKCSELLIKLFEKLFFFFFFGLKFFSRI